MKLQSKITNEGGETLKAGCVVMNDKKEVLLVTDNEKKIWAFPKGHAEAGESLEQAALREVKEETGYDVEIIRRLADVNYVHGQTGELIRVTVFLAKPLSKTGPGEYNLNPQWFSTTEAKELIFSNLAPLLDEI